MDKRTHGRASGRSFRRQRALRRAAAVPLFTAACALFLLGAGNRAAEPPAPVREAGTAAVSSQAPSVQAVSRIAADGPDAGAPPLENAGAAETGASPLENTGAESAPSGDDWALILVNPWNPLPDAYSVTLTQLKNGHAVDERCYPDLQAMMDGCRAAGLSPLICSSYRSQSKQESLFRNKVDRLLAQGLGREEAEAEAGKAVAVPGTSEHQLGLAVDIVDLSNQNLDKTQEDTAVQKWLMAHSWEYGFILRYPSEKSGVTGIIYEPWHYRYVGRDAARDIHEQGVCLEEYLAQRSG